MQLLKLGTIVKDDITKTKGILTHVMIHIGHNKEYIYQPKGLNPKTGQPVDKLWIQEGRILGGEFIDVDVPVDLLGSKAEDIGSGFKGRIVSLIYHINGCFHAELKPEGTLESTGSTVAPCEFDVRRLKGDKIVPMEEKVLQKELKAKPSPMGMPERNKG